MQISKLKAVTSLMATTSLILSGVPVVADPDVESQQALNAAPLVYLETKNETSADARSAQGPISFTDIFQYYMDDTEMRDLFRDAQWELLNLAEDTNFTHFFYNTNQHYGSLFDLLRVEHANQLERYSAMAQGTMGRLQKGFTRRYDRIFETIQYVASSTGFSSKAVENLEIYVAAGPVNAFTVSGNHDRIIVVINSELVDKLNNNEIRAVLAHELGHIRSLHSVKGAMHQLLLNTLAMTLLDPNSQSPESMEDEVFRAVQGIIEYGSLHKCNLHNHANGHNHVTHGNGAFNLSEYAAKGKSQKNLSKEHPALYMALVNLMKMDPKQKVNLLQEYLEYIITTLEAQKASPETLAYFQELQTQNLPPRMVQPSAVQLLEHIQVAVMAISRAQETSSDRYATSNAPNLHVASTMAKLMGFDFKPHERKGVLMMLKKQYEDYQDSTPEHVRNRFRGTTHPALPLRISDIMDNPEFPSILFADPFFRTVFQEDLVRTKVQNTKNRSHLFTKMAALQKDIMSGIIDFGVGAKKNVRFDKLIQYIASAKEQGLVIINMMVEEANEAGLNEKQSAVVAKKIQTLATSLLEENPLLALIDAELVKAQVRNTDLNSATRKNIDQRLKVVRDLRNATEPEQVDSIHRSVMHPLALAEADVHEIRRANADTAKRIAAKLARPPKASRGIPLDGLNPANPTTARKCADVLMGLRYSYALIEQARAKEAARAAMIKAAMEKAAGNASSSGTSK